jgi:hypothetical protein
MNSLRRVVEGFGRGMGTALYVAVCLGCCVSGASADWPSGVGTSIDAGPINNFIGGEHAMVAGDDGSVWVSWQDSFCVGQLRVQRVGFEGDLLIPMGIEAQDDPTCGFFLPPSMTVVGDELVVSRALASVPDSPVLRFDEIGAPVWGEGYAGEEGVVQGLGQLVTLSNGDVLVVTSSVGSILAQRIDADGKDVWDEPAVVIDGISSSHRIFTVVADQSGGAIVFWDTHLAYTKLIYAMRIDSEGQQVWNEILRIVEAPPGVSSSRHSDPIAVSDGANGAVLVFAKGFETGTTPAPLLMQRILSDGSLAFDIGGVRVSESSQRQFFPELVVDPSTRDVFVVWYEGLNNASVRAQRMDLQGQQLWGSEGIEVRVLSQNLSRFDADVVGDELWVVSADLDEIAVHAYSANGTPKSVSGWGVTDEGSQGRVQCVASGDGVVVGWIGTNEDGVGSVFVQRVNDGGRLGNPACSDADLAEPFGSLNFLDVSAFLGAFAAQDLSVDFESDGSLNFLDVSAFLSIFSGGCP